MTEQEASQSFHDLFTDAAKEWAKELEGELPPEEVVRALMMAATSFCAAT